jgi:hypothetical protein
MVICGVPIMWFVRSWSTNLLLERLPATRIPDPRSRPLQLIRASREPPWLSAGARRATRVSDLSRAAAIVDGVLALGEADADIEATGGHGGCFYRAAVYRGD